MKTNTQARDMRALQRNLVKMRQEMSENKHKAILYRKRVTRTATGFLMHLQSVKKERDLLRKSLKNFNESCCQQLRHIRQQDEEIKTLRQVLRQTAVVNHDLHLITYTKGGRRTTSI